MQRVKEVMTKPVAMVKDTDTIEFAARLMRDLEIGFLVVADKDAPVGCITDRDIVTQGAAKGWDPALHLVEEVMTPALVSCSENTKVERAARLMEKNKIYRLVVHDNNHKAIGVLSYGDLTARCNPPIDLTETLRVVAHVANQ